MNRRDFLSAALALAAAPTGVRAADRPLTSPPKRSQPAKRKLALLTTTYHYLSHAYHIAGRFLHGYLRNDGYHFPDADIVSMYVEQTGEKDMSRGIAKSRDIRQDPTIAEAITMGTGERAGDGAVFSGGRGGYVYN